MGRAIFTLFLLTVATAFGSHRDYLRAREKIELITTRKARPGSIISFTPAQVQAYALGEIAAHRLRGVRDVRVSLAENTIRWWARMDFAQIPQLKSLAANPLLGALLQHDSPVAMTLQLHSAHREATIDVRRVAISQVVFEGATLDFLVKLLVSSAFPGARIGKPFPLAYDMEWIHVRPTGITVKIADSTRPRR